MSEGPQDKMSDTESGPPAAPAAAVAAAYSLKTVMKQ